MTSTTTPIVDPVNAGAALRLLIRPGQVFEIRALEAVTTTERRPGIISGYFDSVDAAVEEVGRIHRAKGIYFTPNPLNPALLARAHNRIRPAYKDPLSSDADVIGRRWLLVDADPKRPTGISSSDSEHAAAIDRAKLIRAELYEDGWPDPILADSGNGAHLLYPIDLATDDGGLVQRCLAALAARFDDDTITIDQSVFNPARIWKLYGTVACKGDDTPERPHRMARILETPADLAEPAHDPA